MIPLSECASGATVCGVALAILGCGGSSDRSNVQDCPSSRTISRDLSQNWMASRGQRTDSAVERRRMIADKIVDCRLLRGSSKADVERLLGHPGQRYTDAWIYTVGDERGPVTVDSELLNIEFRAGRVTSANLTEG